MTYKVYTENPKVKRRFKANQTKKTHIVTISSKITVKSGSNGLPLLIVYLLHLRSLRSQLPGRVLESCQPLALFLDDLRRGFVGKVRA